MSNPFQPPQDYPPPGNSPTGLPPYGVPGQFAPPGPPMYGTPLPPGTVKNWLIESILALLFCGGVLAIPAIIFAAQVDGHLRQGNYQAAVEASNSAKLWLMIAVGVGAGFSVFCCGIYILAAIAGAVA